MNDINVSTKDHVGDYDAIESAKPGEPLFPIQGGDPIGPPTVQFWAELARATARACLQGGKVVIPPIAFGITDAVDGYEPSQSDENNADRLLRKATNAEQVSWAMMAYQRDDEEPTGGRASYNDLPETLTVDAADRAAKRKTTIAMVGQLNNAVAVASGVSEGLAKIDQHPDVAKVIDEAVESLKLSADAIEPRRGRERS